MKIYFDGGAVPNPGLMHVAITIDGEAMESQLGHGTNNVAEWTALLWAMETALARDARDVEILGDSKLVVMQATGAWKINKPEFLAFKSEFDVLKRRFKTCAVRHVGRGSNLAGLHIDARLKRR
jgi:ribonuclease HI